MDEPDGRPTSRRASAESSVLGWVLIVTSILAFAGGRAGFLTIAIATHALVGYVLGARFFGRPGAGMGGAVLADLDLLFPAAWGVPLVHRGITHTLLAAGIVVAVAATRGSSVAGAVGSGYASHLLIDATTPKGVPLAYPLSSESFAVPVGGHSLPVTVLLWGVCLAVLWRSRSAD